MPPGLILATFLSMFPQFSSVSTNTINNFINLINTGYLFTQQNVTDPNILNPYYNLLAHLIAVSTQPTGIAGGPSPSIMPSATTAGLVSASFQAVKDLTLDQVFMNSTWYGQVFWMFTKQEYVKSYYFNF